MLTIAPKIQPWRGNRSKRTLRSEIGKIKRCWRSPNGTRVPAPLQLEARGAQTLSALSARAELFSDCQDLRVP
jgi:hypothetical protein